MSNLKFYLALNKMEKIGPRTVMKLLKKWPDLSDLFKESASQLEKAGLPSAIAHRIAHFDLKHVEADLTWMTDNNHHILCWDDAAYPELLREIHDPPIVLYLRGKQCSLTKPAIAMVGSRNPSIQGSDNAYQFAKALASHQVAVCSGLALGIDAQAHRGCVDAEGVTWAVLGTGVDCIYPWRHQHLAEKIMEKGLLISEFPLKTAAFAGHFPRRNRIISGLSLCTLVVEAAIKSGSLITARYALEQNRDVLAIPGSIQNPKARGCHHLLKQGARLVTSVEDILEELEIPLAHKIQENSQSGLARQYENLVKCLGFEVTTVDQLVQRSACSLEEVLCQLAELELEGVVKPVPGGYLRLNYEREFI